MPRGGRRSTTWTSSWNLGETKRIRVPIAIADDVTKFARLLDSKKLSLDCLVPKQNSSYKALSQGEVKKQQEATFALTQDKVNEAIFILEQSITLKANAGGKIKAKVKEAIALLQNNQEIEEKSHSE